MSEAPRGTHPRMPRGAEDSSGDSRDRARRVCASSLLGRRASAALCSPGVTFLLSFFTSVFRIHNQSGSRCRPCCLPRVSRASVKDRLSLCSWKLSRLTRTRPALPYSRANYRFGGAPAPRFDSTPFRSDVCPNVEAGRRSKRPCRLTTPAGTLIKLGRAANDHRADCFSPRQLVRRCRCC
jgi:hypothetical protein